MAFSINQPIHAGGLRKLEPKATIGEICQTVWDLIEANEIEIYDQSHIIVPKVCKMGFRDTTEIDDLIKEMEAELYGP